jgi:rhodanese-related sulfurtransferase
MSTNEISEFQQDIFESKHQVIITSCLFGIKNDSVKKSLHLKEYKNIYNGGGWNSLKDKI